MIHFIACGVPRSGTTALANLLNWHPNVFCGIERFPLERVDRSYFTPQAVQDSEIPTAHYERNLATLSEKAEIRALGDKGPRYFYRVAGNPESFSGIKLLFIIRKMEEVFQSWNVRATNPNDLSWHRGQTGVFAYLDTLQLVHSLQLLESSHEGMVVSYENLFYGEHPSQHRIIDRIFEFLEVSSAPEAIEQFDSESGKRQSLRSREVSLRQEEFEFIDLTRINKLSKDLSRLGGCVSLKNFAQQSRPVLEDFEIRKDEILSAVDGLLLAHAGFDQAMTMLGHCYRLSEGTNVFNTLETEQSVRAPIIGILAAFFDSLQKNDDKAALKMGESLLEQHPSSPMLLNNVAEIFSRIGNHKRAHAMQGEAKRLKSLGYSADGRFDPILDTPRVVTYASHQSKDWVAANPAQPARGQQRPTRLQIIRQNLNLSGFGLEIGPLHKPIVQKTEGNVKFLDRLDTQRLREKYRNHPNISESKIEEIDYVLVENDLRLTVPDARKFDYIIASHVIQQVPNLVRFLQQLDTILNSSGIISLAIPDKRYCLDLLKGDSTLGEVLAAYYEDYRRPSFFQVFNHVSQVTKISAPQAWRGRETHPLHTKVYAYQVALDSQLPDRYSDIHCWAFTPASFTSLIESLFEMKLISLGVSVINPTRRDTNEFFVQLRRV